MDVLEMKNITYSYTISITHIFIYQLKMAADAAHPVLFYVLMDPTQR